MPGAGTFREDFGASVVVALVALPLCVGVAVASGVPAELGIVTGVVGGLVTGWFPGSSLQVSGPAAGLTVLVYEAVRTYGLPALGVLVLVAGLVQLCMGALRLGRWFRAISVAVVHGMLAGIGLVLIAGQLYALADVRAPAGTLEKLAGVVGLAARADWTAVALGAGTVAVLVLWRRMPDRLRLVPGALVGVAAATAAAMVLRLPVERVSVTGVLEAVTPPGWEDFGVLASVGALGTVIALALIASAETLFSAAAVDRMHDGAPTDYDRELVAQGVGNTLCGLLGALPMTAVIVRSAANVEAGARTRAARILHGGWLLLFAVAVPGLLEAVPLAALAGVLLHAGWKLLPARAVAALWRTHRGEAVVLVATACAIVATNLFEGVLAGLGIAIAKAAWETSHVHVEQVWEGEELRVRILGNASFLRLPKLLDELDALPHGNAVRLDLTGLRHLDHACLTALDGWERTRTPLPGREGVS
ncbi:MULTISPECIES: SulP family inorganic anion transporter [unclassified Streptomyces]|uniref:SulP family inorganic anion transporter n=1 Tax=unclassified Streptomyces TaxID=2593676 RepID=UPI000DC7B80C|nr:MULTISPECIES: SulP family inorganic anion transporter [unclassified Streptomyces]AWZ06976.1 SulP family inorganic anion transporter [Streptomyces sp. ICC4]AWZ15574.1 SulP family inorganic anion transporter [Streptomyces sp. ICC1]